MNIPGLVKVGAFTYTIRYEDRLVNADHQRLRGHQDTEHLEIALDTGMNEQMERSTLMHELTHAIAEDRCLDFSEEIIDQFAAGLTQVLMDNPKLVLLFLGEDE